MVKGPLDGRRCGCHHRSHGAYSSWHRKAEIELFGSRCELEHVYTKNERIAVHAVAVALKVEHVMAMADRAASFTLVKEVLDVGVLSAGSEDESVSWVDDGC